MGNVTLDLHLEGHAAHRSALDSEGLSGVTVSVEGTGLIVEVVAPSLRVAQERVDAVLALLSTLEASL